MINYPPLCIEPGAVLLIGDYATAFIGSNGADALLRQYGSLPNGSQMRFVHDLLTADEAASVFQAWRDSRSGSRPLAMPSELAGGISDPDAAARWLSPKGQQWYFSGSPRSSTPFSTGLMRVDVSLVAHSVKCGSFA